MEMPSGKYVPMKYVMITFLPGSAGNFFTRCLNLLSGGYCFIEKNSKKLPSTIEEKLRMLNYNSVSNLSFNERNWVSFESSLDFYFSVQAHHDLPQNSYSIWLGHPDNSTTSLLAELAGPDDKCYSFYIDPGKKFKWCLINALYKNSQIDVTYYVNAKKLMANDSVHKINFENFLQGWDYFLLEFQKVCNIIEHNILCQEVAAIKILYFQWQQTILNHDDIDAFKHQIGFDI